MMDVGFIGTGNMGGALIRGYSKSNTSDKIHIYDKSPAQAEKFSNNSDITSNISVEKNIDELVRKTDIIILAVKPNVFEIILLEIRKILEDDPKSTNKIFVSIAAGISINFIKGILGRGTKTIRTMPNLNSMVSQGMTALCRDSLVDDNDCEPVKKIFDSVGKTVEVNEDMIDTVIGVSGSSPAYTFMYIDALIKCAVKNGMKKDDALIFASQATLGAAVTVMESGIDPETLTKNVCSPGGTTIEAVTTLREHNFEDTIDKAMTAAIEKSKKMTR